MTDALDVGKALLGSWPQQVSQWGGEAIAAYVEELDARGLSPAEALDAIRTWPTPEDKARDFPPSAAALAAHARRDPDAPSFDEMLEAVWGPGGVLAARTTVRKPRWKEGERWKLDREAMLERLGREHERVQLFVLDQGLGRLRGLGLADEENEFREVRRRELRVAWDALWARTEGRDVKALVARRRLELEAGRGGVRQLDPVSVVGVGPGERRQVDGDDG